jgi:anti-repressor protein
MENEIVKVNYENERATVLGRDLHEALEIKTRYNDWFPRMCEYGFVEGVDFYSFLSESEGGRPAQDHQLTIEMAKEICMIQRNEIGKEIRQYFIQLEKAWNSPEQVMSRALRIADETIKNLKIEMKQLQGKADYFDSLVDRNLLTSFRDTAKEFKIKEKFFIKWLIDNKYIYRDNKNSLRPYAQYSTGEKKYFEIKEYKTDKFSGIQTLITPRGRETFRLLLQAEENKK